MEVQAVCVMSGKNTRKPLSVPSVPSVIGENQNGTTTQHIDSTDKANNFNQNTSETYQVPTSPHSNGTLGTLGTDSGFRNANGTHSDSVRIEQAGKEWQSMKGQSINHT